MTNAVERCYRALLRLYPRAFAERFGDDMMDFFRDRLRGARRDHGSRGVAIVLVRAVMDVLVAAAAERADALRGGLRARRRRGRGGRGGDTLDLRKDEMVSTMGQDIRFAARGMLRKPGFAAVVLATLALGIGANVAIFSVVSGVLLRPLPYRDIERIVHVQHEDPFKTVSEPEFVDYRDGLQRIERLAAYSGASATITGDPEPERVQVTRVSDGFFTILGVPAAVGRTFVPEEDRRHAPPRRAVVLSHGLWQRRFGGDPGVVGRQIRINDIAVTVVGVMPERFAFPTPETAIWTPLRLNYDTLWTRNNHYLQLIGRLAPGASVAGVSADMNTLARQFTRDYPETYGRDQRLTAVVTPLRDELLGRTRPYLLALLGSVGFVLLIACVNVANLLLARGESRRKELAIRTALGASRRRIVRQVLTESALYAAAGGVFGVGLAWWGVRALRALAPSTIPRVDEVTIDLPVLGFALALSAATGLLFGLFPALRGAREDTIGTLRQGGKTSSQYGLGQARGVLVVAEVALAVVMLTGSGLMLRSLWKLQAIDLGIRPEHLLTMRVSYPERPLALNELATAQAAIAAFYRDLARQIEALPGVRSAAAVGDLPIADGNSTWSILIDDAPMTSVGEAPSATPLQVTPGYFGTMGIPVLRGREFTDQDREDAPLVAVVNETMARQMWPGRSAIGGRIRMLNPTAPRATVVGVVRDVRSGGYQGEVPPTMYFPHAQAGRSAYYVPATMTLVIKTDADPLSVTGPVRDVIRRLNPNVPASRIQTMESVVASSVSNRRFSTTLLAAFAALALVLAGIGIYGVIAYDVSQRTYEIGLRMALGARTIQVVRLMVGRGVRMAAIGLALGVAGSLAVTRLIAALLVDVSRVDPPTLAGVVVVLAVVSVAAAYVPARRASAVDPMVALRRD